MRPGGTELDPRVRSALRCALAGDARSARDQLVTIAVPLNDRSAATAARVLYLVRAYDDALRLLERSASAYLVRLRYALLKRLRFEQEASGVLEQLLAVSADAVVHEAAALHYRGVEEYERALLHTDALLAARPDAAHWHRSRLELAAFAGRTDVASAAARAAYALEPDSWQSLVDDLVRAGGFETAQAIVSAHEGAPRAAGVAAELALFMGDYERTRALAEGVDDPRARTALFGALIATAQLGRADQIAGFPSAGPTWTTWLAELQYRRGDYSSALQTLQHVQNHVPDYLAAKLLFTLTDLELQRPPRVHRGAYEGLFLGQIQALGVDLPGDEPDTPADTLRDALHQALAHLRGNRTPWPTIVRDGRLELVRVPASGRHRVRRAQHASRHLGIDAAAARVDVLLDELDHDPVAECYRGELDLWAGRYEAAETRFRSILAVRPRTTWGWIGLGAAQTLSGHPGKGLDALDEGVTVLGFRGATLPVYRAEALWRQGRLLESSTEVDEALRLHPGRLSAWLLRTIIASERGDAATRDLAFDYLQGAATALLSDAAGCLGAPPGGQASPQLPERATSREPPSS